MTSDKARIEPIAQFAARTKDARLLASSTSGGAFTELARVVLGGGGVVVGAAWSSDFKRVEHIVVKDEKSLARLRGSKYVSSDMTSVWRELKELLASKRQVLFTGLPCQCAAVRKAFGEDQNLYVCAIMCHCVVKPEAWTSYLSEIEQDAGKRVISVNMRSKESGWENSSFQIGFSDGSKLSETPTKNLYMQAFYCGLTVRESCLDCRFRFGKANADLMIGDFWGIEKIVPKFSDDQGVSAILAYTRKGLLLIESSELERLPVSYGDILAGNASLESSISPDLRTRKRFAKVFKHRGLSAAYSYAYKRTLFDRVLGRLKGLLKR